MLLRFVELSARLLKAPTIAELDVLSVMTNVMPSESLPVPRSLNENAAPLFTNNGNIYQVSYEGGTGNDMTLTIVPEPVTWEILAIGMLLLPMLMRSRKDAIHF